MYIYIYIYTCITGVFIICMYDVCMRNHNVHVHVTYNTLSGPQEERHPHPRLRRPARRHLPAPGRLSDGVV